MMDQPTRALLETLRAALEAKVEPWRVLSMIDYALHDGPGYGDLAAATRALHEWTEQARQRDKESVT
jgi:hypothetical protein